jgi:hypothetical protein
MSRHSPQHDAAQLKTAQAAFRGAYSLAWAATVLGLTGWFMWVLRAHLSGWAMSLGMLAISLTTAVVLMLFLSGPLKLGLFALFRRFYPVLRDAGPG